MHNKDKYPEIWTAKEKAEAKLAPFMAKRVKVMAKLDAVAKEIDALKVKKSAFNDEANVDHSAISALKKEISRLARAMGGIAA